MPQDFNRPIFSQENPQKLIAITSEQEVTVGEHTSKMDKSDDRCDEDKQAVQIIVKEVSATQQGETIKNDDSLDVLGEDLDLVLSKLTLRDEAVGKEIDRPSMLLKAYLFKNEGEFARVLELRDKGWRNKEQGDAFFKEQRERADKADHKGEARFFNMMEQIAMEMNEKTGALSPLVAEERAIKVLDICMAPGGYSAAILKLYSTAELYGITLGKEDGGHPVMIPDKMLRGIKSRDVTLFVSEFVHGTGRPVPKSHPDFKKFDPIRPFISHKMDIVFCDGIVLRTHERASYREKNEAIRLATSQLILAMQRIVNGGTLIMLLLKVDSWSSTKILFTFSKFATVELFKPAKKHSTRSSFYMVAKNVDVERPSAKAAVAEWKSMWYEATFGGEEETGGKKCGPDDKYVLQVIHDFGPTLIKMGVPIWSIQADALSKTEYAGNVPDSVDSRKENLPLQKPISEDGS